MRIETIKKLCCPFDKAALELTIITKDMEGNVLEGYLYCKECKRIYPIVSGIPIMSPDEYREFKLEQPLLQRWTNDKVTDNFRLTESESVKNTYNEALKAADFSSVEHYAEKGHYIKAKK